MSLAVANRLPTPPPPTEAPWSLDVLGPPAFECVVFGVPGPQGSKKHVGKGRMIESSAKVKPWRAAVAGVARVNHRARPLLDGPLVADMIFTMPKGTTLPKWRDWHDVTPDLSKLARSTEDALTGIVWTDDGRVTAYRRLDARFVGSDDPDTLPQSGAVIRVWQVPAVLIEARKAAARKRS